MQTANALYIVVSGALPTEEVTWGLRIDVELRLQVGEGEAVHARSFR